MASNISNMAPESEEQVHGGLGYWVGSLASSMRKGLGQELAPFDVSPVQWAILEMCYRGEANTLTGLSRVIPIDAAAISRQVAKLVAKGLIRRRRQSRDRRLVRLDLTEAGRSLVPELAKCVQANNAKFLAGISEEEQEVMILMVERMLRNAQTAVHREEETDCQ